MEAIKEPFHLSFKAMNLFGFFLPENCKYRWKIYGKFVFLFVHVQFVIASMYRLILIKNFDEFIVAILYVIFSVNLTLKIVNFMAKRDQILEMVEEFNDMERKINSNLVENLHMNIKKFVRQSFVMDACVGFTLSLTVLLLNHSKSFVIPVLYGTTNDFVYYALYLLQYIQVYGIGSSSVAVESIFTVCLMMVQSQIDFIRKSVTEMTDITQEKVKEIVEFHVRVNKIRDKIQSIYGFIILIESSLISFFICILVYKMIHSSIQEKPSDFVYFFGFALIMLSKVFLPHIHGQRIISKSEKIVDDLYEINWYEKDVKQRKILLILMLNNRESMKINIKGFYNLDMNNLGAIFQAAYSFYSVVKSMSE